MLTASTSGVAVIASERDLSGHESKAGLSVTAYFLARQLVSLPFVVLQPFFFLVTYIQAGETYASWPNQLGVLACLAFAASGLGCAVATFFFKSPYLVTCILTIFVGVFNSYSPQFETLEALGFSKEGARYLLAWSPVRWASEGMLLAEVEGLPPGMAAKRDFLIKQYDFQFANLSSGQVFIWPIVFGFIARLLAYTGTYLKSRVRK